MNRLIVFLMLAAMLACFAGCAKKNPYESYNRSIQRADEGFRELDRSVQ